jgi:hypothetical protein
VSAALPALLGLASIGIFPTLRYLAYLRFARRVSKEHGVEGIKALRFVARPLNGDLIAVDPEIRPRSALPDVPHGTKTPEELT